MPHDQAAKGFLFVSIALSSVCVCMRVCACGMCGEKSLGISHGLTGSEKQRTCADHTRNEALSAASHSYNAPCPLPLPHAQCIPSGFWSICVSTKLLVS